MRIYLGASFVAQKRLRSARDEFFRQGHSVIGSWLDEVAKPADMTQEIFDEKLAHKDLQEIREADCFILDSFEPSTTGGRYVELGVALSNLKLIYHVGPVGSIFERLVDRHFDTWEECFDFYLEHHPVDGYVATGMEDKVFSGTSGIKEPQKKYGIWVFNRPEQKESCWYVDASYFTYPPLLFSSMEAAQSFIDDNREINSHKSRGVGYEVKEYIDLPGLYDKAPF